MTGVARREPDLVPGSLLGCRTFRLDQDGDLKSAVQDYFWRGGVNTAICLADRTGARALSIALRRATYPRWMIQAFSEQRADHSAPSDTCSCGFYAVWDTYDAWHAMSNHGRFRRWSQEDWRYLHYTAVLAVVEATGRVLLGTKGFRAEKCEVKALLLPDPEEEWWLTRRRAKKYIEKIKANYPGIEIFYSEREMFAAYPVVVPKTLLHQSPSYGDYTAKKVNYKKGQ